VSWPVWIFGIWYPLVALLLVRPLAGHFAWRFYLTERNWRYCSMCMNKARLGSPNGEQWFGAFCLACLVSVLWPGALVWATQGAKGLKLGAERQAELDRLRKRNEQLERELGVSA